MRHSKLTKLLLLFFSINLVFFLGFPINSNAGKLPAAKPSSSIELTPELIEGLAAKAEVVEDSLGIAHIFAKNLDDVYFMQGMLHARDRFFQMDVTRRTVEGTLAELLGPGVDNSNITSDVQLRAFNLKPVAEKTVSMLRPETKKILKAYTKGVNAYLMANPLPPEYQALKITQKRLWKDSDTVLVGKGLAFSLSFDISDLTNTLALESYQAAGKTGGFDGNTLFFEDIFRRAPFDPTFAIPDAMGSTGQRTTKSKKTEARLAEIKQYQEWGQHIEKTVTPKTLEMVNNYVEKIKNIPLLSGRLNQQAPDKGSNWFVLSGKLTDSGAPLLNNDPHLALTSPPIWYQIQLNVAKKNKTLLNVTGVSIAGVPGVVLGHNDNIAWGATTTFFDVIDVYQEKIDAQLGSISIIHDGKKEPVTFRDETFRVNAIADGKTDNIQVVPPSNSVPGRLPNVARRNNGPIIGVDLAGASALSIQYVGTSPTFEIETFLDFNRAKSVQEFQKALEFFDFGSQNFSVATTTGDIAYFTTGEVPLREDLEAGKVTGAPPFLLRDGSTGNEWIPLKKRLSNQVTPYEILPPEELPQIINPPAGFVVTANNDPIGITASNNLFVKKRATGGFYYIAPEFATGSRASRLTKDIQEAIASGKKITVEMARRFQADVRMRDAEIFMPVIQQAFTNAQTASTPQLAALAKDPGVQEAINRFKTWDFSTPTGLRVGYDAFVPYNQSDPSQKQIDNSVSATIYSLWRSQVVRDTLDATLSPFNLETNSFNDSVIASFGNLLLNFSQNKGKGASGLDFFQVPELSSSTPETRRDFILLRALRRTLDALAGPDFELAFQRSTKQSDYRWGALHRVLLPSDLGRMSEFSIPSSKSNFQSPLPNLFGLPRDGGFSVPNASGHSIRAKAVNDFIFTSGPSKRSTYVMKPNQITYVTAVPGGQSGVIGNKFRDNLLNFWLVSDVYPVLSSKDQLLNENATRMIFKGLPKSETK